MNENSNVISDVMGLETRLRELLDAERAPIMGPCLESIRCTEPELLEHRVLTAIQTSLRRSNDPVDGIVSCLRQWPAISVLLFTCQVNESYNSENEYAVHRAIEELIGSKTPLTDVERKHVWREFRDACYGVRLKTNSRKSGQGYMIEEFLHQAGLPLAFVERVTEQMIRTASEVGMADEDDPEGLARWHDRLLWHSRFLAKTAQRALEADETFYYPRIFLKASTGGGVATSDKTAAGIMARVLTQSSNGSERSGWHRALRIPRLLWREDQLVVEIPAGDSQEWQITVDDSEYTYRAGIVAETAPVTTCYSTDSLPRTVTVASGDFSREYVLWEDKADNRLLIFNSVGHWLKAAALGSDSINLPPGQYLLLLRFEPSTSDEDYDQVSYDPDLFLLPITLRPGQEYRLRRGPAELCLKADRRSWIRFEGDRLVAFSGEDVFFGRQLRLDLVLGERQDASLTAQEDEDTVTRAPQYELRFEVGGVELARIPAQDGTIEVKKVFENLPPGLCRLVAELCPAGTARALVRTAILYWAGLHGRGSDGVLHLSQWPDNIDTSGCENTSFDQGTLTLKPQDLRRPTFRTGFRTAQGRTIDLDWLVPGLFMELADYSISPVLRRRLDIGISLAASSLSRQVLQIRSTEAGRLLLNGTELRQLRANHSISVNVSGLAERLLTGSGVLQFESDGHQLIDLSRLVAPHQILGFSQRIERGQCLVQMRFALRCTEIRCSAENVLSGQWIDLSASCDDPNSWAETNPLRLESQEANNEGFQYLLTVETADLPIGAWFFDFEVCLDGRWGAPTNIRQDAFAFGILMSDHSLPVTRLEAVLEQWSGLDRSIALLDLFCKLHAKLQRCFAPESWPSLSWLKALWDRWVREMWPLDGHKIRQLVRLSEMMPPESASHSWLPTQRVEAAMPHLFVQQARMYSGIYQPRTGLSCCLSAIARLEQPLRRFPGELIDTFAASGFDLGRMVAGDPPASFDFEIYRKSLLNSPLPLSVAPDWLPMDGELLGRSHYQQCWERMRDRYRDTVSGNDARRQYGMRLCREIERKERPPVLCLRRLERRHDESESVEDGLLCAIESFLSSLAMKCRKDVYSPGVLVQHQAALQTMLSVGNDSFPLPQVLSLTLQLGGDLFGFYLLLWELILAASTNLDGEEIHG